MSFLGSSKQKIHRILGKSTQHGLKLPPLSTDLCGLWRLLFVLHVEIPLPLNKSMHLGHLYLPLQPASFYLSSQRTLLAAAPPLSTVSMGEGVTHGCCPGFERLGPSLSSCSAFSLHLGFFFLLPGRENKERPTKVYSQRMQEYCHTRAHTHTYNICTHIQAHTHTCIYMSMPTNTHAHTHMP